MKNIWTYCCLMIWAAGLCSCEKEEESIEGEKSGLVAFYDFDAGDANDLSGNQYDGNTVGSPSYIIDTPDGTGKALYLNATKGQYLSIPYNPINTTDAFTFSFWMKDFSVGMIMTVMGSDGTSYSHPYVYISNNKFYMRMSALPVGTVLRYNGIEIAFGFDVSSIYDDSWHLFAFSFADNKLKIYVDGQKIEEAAVTYYKGYCNQIMFGGKGGFSNGTAMSIKLDNIRMYNRELSGKEIVAIYDKERTRL